LIVLFAYLCASFFCIPLFVQIADFGESKFNTRKDGTGGVTMTANIGTPVFMAPELMVNSRKVKYTPKIDVFSFGILAWQCIYRRQPYDDDNVRNGQIKSPSKMNPWMLRAAIADGLRPLMFDTEDDGAHGSVPSSAAATLLGSKMPINTQMISLNVVREMNAQASQQQQQQPLSDARYSKPTGDNMVLSSQTQRMSLTVLGQVNRNAAASNQPQQQRMKVNRLRTPVVMKLRTLVQNCWDEDPTKRPTFANIDLKLRQIRDAHFPLSDEY
jgi:serine/threonine protein kinase